MEACDNTKRILNYCKDALKELTEKEHTGASWERRWVSLISLLRTTCEVLKKDAPIYWKQHMKKPNAHISERDGKNKWSPDIFGKFIWTDANLFLHEGKSTAGQSRRVFIQGVSARASVAGEKLEPRPRRLPSRPSNVLSYELRSL